MSQGRNKSWMVAGVAAVVLAMLVYGLRPAPVGVDQAVISRGPMTVQVEEEGKTRVRQVYTVSAPIAGRVLRSPVEAGDVVTKDKTVVAILQPSDPPFLDVRARSEIEAQIAAAAAAVALALAELRQAEAELEFAETDFERSERLSRTGTIAERVLQKARAPSSLDRKRHPLIPTPAHRAA